MGVARRGQQRSLFRIFQVLRVTITRSPRARIFGWVRFTAFCRRDSFGRSGAASLAQEAGTDLKTLQDMLGHSSIVVTSDTYTSVLPHAQRRCADATAHSSSPPPDAPARRSARTAAAATARNPDHEANTPTLRHPSSMRTQVTHPRQNPSSRSVMTPNGTHVTPIVRTSRTAERA